MTKQPERLFIITHSQVQLLVKYVMSVPTGNLPGSQLVQVLDHIDKLPEVPASILPLLQSMRNAGAAAAPVAGPVKVVKGNGVEDPAPENEG